MKYKVGDRVKYGSEICTITKVLESQGKFKYRVQSDTWFDIVNEDEMIKGLAEEGVNIDVAVEKTTKDISDIVVDTLMGGLMVGKSFNLPEGYQFVDENGNIINATKIVLEKKKKEYPKTYEECLNVLGYDDRETYCIFHSGADERLFEALYRLKVCRDAYWKIAGEEMGLDKPWEPDWNNSSQFKDVIICRSNNIIKYAYAALNTILAFPTEEMRDAFYENFKELIESCKELL